MHPNTRLKDLLEIPSSLKPVLITDAKALYDSYHREGISSSVVDKRVCLEIRVMKERLEELSGSLRWMSSERQVADGLTKESARGLLASRLRHGRLKMTWDPHYVAHKKKTKAEKAAALAESTALPPLPQCTEDFMEDERPQDVNDDPQTEHTTEYDTTPQVNEASTNEEWQVDENDHIEFVSFVQYAGALEYVDAKRHVAPPHQDYVSMSCLKNLFLGLVSFSTLAAGKAESDTCLKVETDTPGNDDSSGDMWLSLFMMLHLGLMMCLVFLCGRASKSPSSSEKPESTAVDASVQKDDPIVLQRWCEIAKEETRKANEYSAAAREARKALDLLTEANELRSLVEDGDQLLKALVTEMEDHARKCPCGKELFVVRKGRCWHHFGCHILEQAVPANVQAVRGCSFCTEHQIPPLPSGLVHST